MPRNPRRRLTRRTAAALPPRPTYPGARVPESESAQPVRRTAASMRASEYVARQTPLLRAEVRRITVVTVVCFALLAVLTVVDRMQ